MANEAKTTIITGTLLLDPTQQVACVVALDIAGGEITGISYITNPDKLTHLSPVAPARRL